jgi:class 3 adenylate cyclase
MRRRQHRDLGDSLQRAIAAKVIVKLRDSKGLQRAVERGIVDSRLIDFDPATSDDPVAAIREFGASLARAIRERPTALAHLEMNAIDLLGEDALGTPEAIGGARRDDRTVVFSDLSAFTAFTVAEGDRTAGRLLTNHYGVVDRIVKSRGGAVIKRLGDGHLLAFPGPEAAVMASLELVEEAPDPLPLRVGAHAGEVMMVGDDIIGHVVNVASRVADAANGGEALVTTEVKDPAALVGGVAFDLSRPRPLKGLGDPMPLWLARRG